jgi:hypothetical protein
MEKVFIYVNEHPIIVRISYCCFALYLILFRA